MNIEKLKIESLSHALLTRLKNISINLHMAGGLSVSPYQDLSHIISHLKHIREVVDAYESEILSKF